MYLIIQLESAFSYQTKNVSDTKLKAPIGSYIQYIYLGNYDINILSIPILT